MKSKLVTVIVASLTLVACASSITPVPFKGPNGRQAYTMRCSGKGRTIEMCNRKASAVCPHGYDIVEEKKPKLTAQEKTAALVDDTTASPDHLSVECK